MSRSVILNERLGDEAMKEKKINVGLASIPLIVVIILGLLSATTWKAGMYVPLIGSIAAAALVGVYLGKSWETLQKGLVNGVSRALPALFILVIVGAITGTWIQGGIIPTLIYYALEFISPAIFIPAACLVTAIIATSTGSSFTSIATIGLALMATGLAMGFPPGLLAAAIICGAFFGDSLSPLSDSTNLASAMTGAGLFETIGHMIHTAIPALLLTSIIYYFIARPYASSMVGDREMIDQLLSGINNAFTISPLLLLVLIAMIILTIKKVPALPTLILATLLGALCGFFVQGESLGAVIVAMSTGYVSNTGVEMVDRLLSSGGVASMASTVMLMTLATALGGIMEEIGALECLVDKIMERVKGLGGLVAVTIFSGLVVAFATGAQLLAIILPARMYAEEYKKRGLDPKNLARIACQIGCVCITLVPWSVPTSYASGMFNVAPAEFIPFLFFPMLLIVFNLLLGFTGISMTPLNKTEK